MAVMKKLAHKNLLIKDSGSTDKFEAISKLKLNKNAWVVFYETCND